MKISVFGWGYKNIRRLYTLDVELNNYQNEIPHVSLIMMQNGTGKTTTIKLMRAALSGSAIKWNAEEVRAYQPVDGEYSEGEFYIKVKFDEEIYTMILKLNYVTGVASYQTIRTDTYGGEESEWLVPALVRDVFKNEEFIRRFVFDGEQAKMTLDSGKQEAENAIKYLYQVNKLDDLENEFTRLANKRKEETISQGATMRSVRVHQNKVSKQEKIYRDLEDRNKVLVRLKTDRKAELNNKQEELQKLISSDADLQERHTKLRSDKERCMAEMKNHYTEIHRILKTPYRVHPIFNERLQNLLAHMQRLKLPKNIAKEFFNELADAPRCICGNLIGENEKSSILRNADEYLGDEDLSVLNAIKSSIKDYQLDDSLGELLARLRKTKKEIKECEMGLEKLALELSDEKQDTKKRLDKEIGELSQAIQRYEDELRKLNAQPGEAGATETNNINLARQSWKDKKDTLEKAMGTYIFSKQVEDIQTYIREIKSDALKLLKETVLQKTNGKIEKIIASERISVEKIDGSLKLKDRAGASEGQTLAIAYAYIGSLFEHSPFEFPFIVDSPAASMDLGVRREVAFIIPQLFEQLIIFVTSGEVEGFADKIYELDDVSYFTIEGVEGSSILHIGKDFFASYQKIE